MVEARYIRDEGTDANQWLTVSDWLRVRVRFSCYMFVSYSHPQPYSVECVVNPPPFK